MLRKSKRPVFFLALLMGPTVLVFGQFNIVPVSAGNIYLKSQLWSLSVANAGSSAAEARINLEMKDIQTHQTVLSAISGRFRISPGAQAMQMQALEPIQYSYGPGAGTDRSNNGMLPVGKYQVCYQLVLFYIESQVIAAENCDEIEVDPLSPPLLTMPENDSMLSTTNPSFTWAPPGPAAMFGDLNYDLLISEVYDGQSITDAIQKNLPLQQAQGLRQPFFSFPLQGPQLEQGKNYVWQIIARDRQQYAAKSEVWIFRVPDKKTGSLTGSPVYMLMGDKVNGAGLIDPGILHIKYVSSDLVHESALQVKDENSKMLTRMNVQIRQGDNFWDIPLSGKFQSHHTYTVIIQNNAKAGTLVFTIK